MKERTAIDQLVEDLFRHESGKMVAVLTGILGAENLLLTEDVVQDTLIEAIKNWTYKGVPDKPKSWLYKVAKNKAFNILKRKLHHQKYISETSYLLQSEAPADSLEKLFSEQAIKDDQLRLMFMCCHPSISKDSQIALILKTLCGFSIGEIAKAFLSNNENITKRLVRARKTIKTNQIPFVVPPENELVKRTDAVLEAIYLLFNEGYSASQGEEVIRQDLCKEAIRLVEIIIEHPSIPENTNAFALLALMQLNTSRFNAREDEQKNIITLEFQDRSIWDYELMEKGFQHLNKASKGEFISVYHILASISAYHCSAKDFDSTNWQGILHLYDKLLELDNSAVVVMNRAIVLSKVEGVEIALEALKQIKNDKTIRSNYLFHTLFAEFSFQLNLKHQAIDSIKRAIEFAPIESEKRMLTQKLILFSQEKNTSMSL